MFDAPSSVVPPPSRAPLAGSGRVVAWARASRTVLAAARASSPLRFVETTFPGTRALGGGLTVHDPMPLPEGDLALALYGSFLPPPDPLSLR